MTDKERFHAIMQFAPGAPMLAWEQGFWGGTIDRWYAEGMPRQHGLEVAAAYGDTVRGPATPIRPGDRVCHDVREGAGLDQPSLSVPVELFVWPEFEEVEVARETGRSVIRDRFGILKRIPDDKGSIPQFLAWPVSCQADFERFAEERLDPDRASRFPADWDQWGERLNRYDGVVALGGHPCGLFGGARYLMGEIPLLKAFHRDPALVRRILDQLVHLWTTVWDRALSRIRVDCIHIWEDMAFKNGPLVGPRLFEEFLVPAYRRLTDLARSHGVRTILVDTDGDCSALLPLFLDAGVTGLYPFEVQSGMDVRDVRRQYPALQILGGIDKRALARGRAAIDEELARRVPGLIERGGFIPMADHQIPPDVGWQDYCYYRRRLAELCAPG